MKIQYPLPCKCAGPKFVSMCPAHQAIEIERAQRVLNAPRRLVEAEAILRDAVAGKLWVDRAKTFLENSNANGDAVSSLPNPDAPHFQSP